MKRQIDRFVYLDNLDKKNFLVEHKIINRNFQNDFVCMQVVLMYSFVSALILALVRFYRRIFLLLQKDHNFFWREIIIIRICACRKAPLEYAPLVELLSTHFDPKTCLLKLFFWSIHHM